MWGLPPFPLSFSAFLYFPHIPYLNRLSELVVTEYLKTDLFHRSVLIAYGRYLEQSEWEIYPLRSLFHCFLQNQSNYKTVLYLRASPTGLHSSSSSGYCGHAVSHRKTRCVFFKPWGSNLSQFFRIQFKGVRLELLAPICKREKSDQCHLPTGGVPPCSRWGCRHTLHQKLFLPIQT